MTREIIGERNHKKLVPAGTLLLRGIATANKWPNPTNWTNRLEIRYAGPGRDGEYTTFVVKEFPIDFSTPQAIQQEEEGTQFFENCSNRQDDYL